MTASVKIRKIDDYELPLLEEAVADFLGQARGQKMHRNKRVLLKPNLLGGYPPERAVTTHPLLLEALVRHFLDKGKEVWIGDSPGGSVNVNSVWRDCGLLELAERYPVKLVNLSTLGFRELEYQGIRVKISEALWQCGIVVNIAKLKTHFLMAYTGAIKNLYGLVPGLVKTYYHGVYPNPNEFAKLLNSLYQLAKGRVTYHFIDGILGMDGPGPTAGRVRKFGLLFGSTSASALDFVASSMMGFKPRDVPYLGPALHADGQLPSRISVPTSFRDFRLPDVDIRDVKLRKDLMRLVPNFARHAFRKVYDVHPIVSDRCRKCGICVKSCPVQAISPASVERFPKVDPGVCIRCMCCHEMCPHSAIDVHKSFIARFIK